VKASRFRRLPLVDEPAPGAPGSPNTPAAVTTEAEAEAEAEAMGIPSHDFR